ncbi:Las1-domain-containing protein [Exidia glandulosa HHB12029]|uniref:Las1-domain-containing protein n=1 Tax=Exidia glandulosa HHB12029 TaxID=1314781 RepID=A0A165K1B1_EXIGL|nr:Las1-domain-containing protein [Exidia glandulosa HHB12029]
MKLPRRVPWASKAELEQLCTWIYSDESPHDAKRRALHRLAAWRVATPLPHALDSVLSLLAAELGDEAGASAMLVRQSYASAIVRFVNGMVDPLQFGAYARSIAGIAAQIGLPAWLVELRHAATHEDLPSLDILREASHEALTWILHNYFMPVLSMAESTARPPVQPPSLAPLLKEYKTLAKQATRDASLRSSLQPDLTRIFRQLERWIGEAKVSSLSVSSGTDDAEANALELLSYELLDKGGLVPIAKKKRLPTSDRLFPPNAEVWRPLLVQVQEQHASFGPVLLATIATRVGIFEDADQDDTSRTCLLSWVVWIVDTWGESAGCGSHDAVSQLLLSIPPTQLSKSAPLLVQLVETLLTDDDSLKARFLALLQPPGATDNVWQDADVSIMKQRLAVIQESAPDIHRAKAAAVVDSAAMAVDAPAVGWRSLAGNSSWQPCPIGVSGIVS